MVLDTNTSVERAMWLGRHLGSTLAKDARRVTMRQSEFSRSPPNSEKQSQSQQAQSRLPDPRQTQILASSQCGEKAGNQTTEAPDGPHKHGGHVATVSSGRSQKRIPSRTSHLEAMEMSAHDTGIARKGQEDAREAVCATVLSEVAAEDAETKPTMDTE